MFRGLSFYPTAPIGPVPDLGNNGYLYRMKHRLLPFLFLFPACASVAQQPRDSSSLPGDTISLREVIIRSPYRASQETPVSFKNLDSQTLNQKNAGQEPSFMLSQTPSVTACSDAGSLYFESAGI